MTAESDITDPPEHLRLLAREWLASLTDAQRREIEELHRTGRLEEAFNRGVAKAVAARQIAAICLDVMRDTLRTCFPGIRR